MENKYVMIQLGYTVFGGGDTVEAARENSRQWLDSPSDADDVPNYDNKGAVNYNLVNGDLVIVPADVADELNPANAPHAEMAL